MYTLHSSILRQHHLIIFNPLPSNHLCGPSKIPLWPIKHTSVAHQKYCCGQSEILLWHIRNTSVTNQKYFCAPGRNSGGLPVRSSCLAPRSRWCLRAGSRRWPGGCRRWPGGSRRWPSGVGDSSCLSSCCTAPPPDSSCLMSFIFFLLSRIFMLTACCWLSE